MKANRWESFLTSWEILFIAGGIAIHFDTCSDERFQV